MTMVTALRDSLARQNLGGLIIWRGDIYSGEEVRACDERLAFISGFTGSAGFALILPDKAVVFSDGRYHLQMAQELAKDIWQWRDSGPNALADYLADYIAETGLGELRLGFDEMTTTLSQRDNLPDKAEDCAITWHPLASHPIDALWHDRPEFIRQSAFFLDDWQTGCMADIKIANAQSALQKAGHDGLFISAVDCANWLCNIRGSDLANTPFHLCFAYLPKQGDLVLIGADLPADHSTSFSSLSFSECDDFLASLTGKVISVDPASLPSGMARLMTKHQLQMVKESCPLLAIKAQKNETELSGFRKAHLIDAAAFCRFWFWLERQNAAQFHETDLVEILQKQRQSHADYLMDSFDAIMGSGANGAIIHYRAQAGSDSLIQPDNLLLIDSGAHYRFGTTDITRTLIIGQADSDMKAAYTAVLASHIALGRAVFPHGTRGDNLDAICRAPLWETGRDYAHGTGHGVGHMLSVHEGPVHISKRASLPLEKGMVLSNEPGFYEAGQWGIRLENLVAVCEAEISGFYAFENLTMVPFETKLIVPEYLDDSARQWLNDYHQAVHQALLPYCDDEAMRQWLCDKCAAI